MKYRLEQRKDIDRIIEDCLVCRLALAVDSSPYLLPFSFGYDGGAIYIHTGLEGKKIRYFEAGGEVCFEFERGVRPAEGKNGPCSWSFEFESVIGYGTISELTGRKDKVYGLNTIMSRYSGREWDFEGVDLSKTRVWKVSVDSVSAVKSEK